MKIYQVGGSVRDEIMKIKPHDFDYVVVGATEKEFIDKYPTAKKVGKSFPVFLVNGSEYAFARCEKKIAPGYRGFEIDCNPKITLKEDLLRRDLTINAIAKDKKTKEYIDPFGGIEDIKRKKIVHVSEKFAEDPLRVYRVARFSAQFSDFTIDNLTIELMKKLKPELKELSSERVYQELMKALEKEAPLKFFETLKKADLLEEHFIEFKDKESIKEHFEAFNRYSGEKLFISFGFILNKKEIKNLCKRFKTQKKVYQDTLSTCLIKDMIDNFDKENPSFLYKFIETFNKLSILNKKEMLNFIEIYQLENIKFITKIVGWSDTLNSLRIPEEMRNKGTASSKYLMQMKLNKIEENIKLELIK